MDLPFVVSATHYKGGHETQGIDCRINYILFGVKPEKRPASMSDIIHGPVPAPLPQVVGVPKFTVSMVPLPTARLLVEVFPWLKQQPLSKWVPSKTIYTLRLVVDRESGGIVVA
jgi:hypothetical protein